MPYITSEEVKTIRTNLKKSLPEFKLSVTKEHHSTVNVVVLAGPLDLPERVQVNHYHYETHFESQPEVKAVIAKIIDGIFATKPQKTTSEDSDYGSIPNFYYNISFGCYGKPYTRKAV